MTRHLIMALVAVGLTGPAAAADTSPEALVQSVASEVLAIIKSDTDIQGGDAKKVIALVEEKVLVEPAKKVWKKGRGPIEKVDNATVTSPSEVAAKIDAARKGDKPAVLLLVNRRGASQFVALKTSQA